MKTFSPISETYTKNYIDISGNLHYEVKRDDGKIFEVTNKKPIRIIEHLPYYRTDAVLYDEHLLYEDVPVFNSFIKAVRFLKENINNFL